MKIKIYNKYNIINYWLFYCLSILLILCPLTVLINIFKNESASLNFRVGRDAFINLAIIIVVFLLDSILIYGLVRNIRALSTKYTAVINDINRKDINTFSEDIKGYDNEMLVTAYDLSKINTLNDYLKVLIDELAIRGMITEDERAESTIEYTIKNDRAVGTRLIMSATNCFICIKGKKYHAFNLPYIIPIRDIREAILLMQGVETKHLKIVLKHGGIRNYLMVGNKYTKEWLRILANGGIQVRKLGN